MPLDSPFDVLSPFGAESGGGGGGFSPLDISGCVGWYDAADAGTITEIDSKVSGWDDKSTEENHMVQTSAGERPAYDSSFAVANNKPAVVWTGGTQHFDMTSIMTPGYCVIVTAYKDGLDSDFDNFQGLWENTASGIHGGLLGFAARNDWWFQTSTQVLESSKNDAAFSSIVLPLPLTVLSVDTAHIVNPFIVNAFGYNDGGSGRGWDGPICEAIFYSADPSGAEITSLKSYLYTKWGITP